ncbi:DUF1674 domain-containing protein [Polycladidibacter hongkongensis]|uniref:DUF1674 domain-containing protein n=1 Tax=Polycladidibacter hongkongensis TaxID=1647556 RepID=UPI0009EA5079|nr:DUF1674 domain-containing protein [Pseudovibrio hongkongensis]
MAETANRVVTPTFKSHEIDRPSEAQEPPKRRFEDLPPAAQRALQEAEARREAIDSITRDRPQELDGRGGLDPVRYADWEVKGITSDF